MIRSINNEFLHICQPEQHSKNRIQFEIKYNDKTGLLIQTPLSTIYEIILHLIGMVMRASV